MVQQVPCTLWASCNCAHGPNPGSNSIEWRKPSHCSDLSPASCDNGVCSAQEGKHWEAFLATQGQVSAEAEETPKQAQQPSEAQMAAHQQVKLLTDRWYPLAKT